MKSGCGFYILMFVIGLAFMCLAPVLEMWIWNWVAVDLFNAPVVDFWQMCGIHWLCAMLFGRTVTVKRD